MNKLLITGFLICIAFKVTSQSTFFKTYDHNNFWNEGNLIVVKDTFLYIYGDAYHPNTDKYIRQEIISKSGIQYQGINNFIQIGDSESYILKQDTIFRIVVHGSVNGDTLDIIVQTLKGDSISLNSIHDPKQVLKSPNPNAMIKYHNQIIVVTTSTIFTPENPLETFRNVGAVYFLNNDLSLDTILVLNDFQGTKALAADIDSKGNLVIFTENRCGTCGQGGGMVRSVVSFDKDKNRLDSYTSEPIPITGGRTGIVMQNDNRVFGFNVKTKVTVRCIDTLGNVVWNNNFDNPNEVRRYAHMQESNDGNIFVTGETVQPYQVNPGFDRVTYIQKINIKDGFPIWERTYSKDTRPTENYSLIYHMHEDNGGSLYLTGDFHNITTSDLLLIKTDSFGCIDTDKCNDHYLLNSPKGLHEYDQLNMRQKQWYYTITVPSGEQKVEMATFGRDSTFFDPDYGPDKFRAVLHTIDNTITKDSFHIRWDFSGKAYYIEKWRFEKFGGVKPYDTLLYDFTLKKGDQFTFPRGFGNARVVHVDSIDLLDGYKRKRIILRHDNASNQQKFGDLTWIEGIGALNGIYYFNDWLFGTKTNLNCYYDRDKKRYSTIKEDRSCEAPAIYNQVPLTDRHWIADYINWQDLENSIRKYYFTDTTTYIKGRAYHELVSHIYNNPNDVRRTNAYFRIEGNKLIYLFNQVGEVVFEDFDLDVGDTIFMGKPFWPGVNVAISKIDTVTFMDGKHRLRHSYYCAQDLDSEPSSFLTYVQGISTPDGLFSQEITCTLIDKPYYTKIRCYYENDVLVYTATGIGIDSCFIKVGTNNIEYGILAISPNPASNYIDIELSNDMILPLQYEIINIAGQRVEIGSHTTSDPLHFDTDNLQAGMYIVQLREKDGKVWRGKVVIE